MELTSRELATILHALRVLQLGCSAKECEHFDDETTQLDGDEIDALCERLNMGERPAADICLAGSPAVNGVCGDADCVCAPKAGVILIRYVDAEDDEQSISVSPADSPELHATYAAWLRAPHHSERESQAWRTLEELADAELLARGFEDAELQSIDLF